MSKIHRASKLVILFRRKDSRAFSIEKVFSIVLPFVGDLNGALEKQELPYTGHGLLNKIKNLKYVYSQRKKLVHITGEVYYTILFSPNSIMTIHDIALAKSGASLKKWLIGLFWYKIPSKVCRKITVISESSKQEFIEYTGVEANKIEVIYNPIDPELKAHPLKVNTRKKVLALGTKENKNLIRLFEACSKFEVDLHIIGKLTEAQKSALTQYKISYTNDYDLDYKKVVQHYIDCDLVAFVSTYEGFGLPIIEAQAIGRPVITSNCSCMPEIAGNGALLVNPYKVEEISSGIEKLLSDNNFRDELLQKGFENIKRFNVEVIADQYKKLYKSLLNE